MARDFGLLSLTEVVFVSVLLLLNSASVITSRGGRHPTADVRHTRSACEGVAQRAISAYDVEMPMMHIRLHEGTGRTVLRSEWEGSDSCDGTL